MTSSYTTSRTAVLARYCVLAETLLDMTDLRFVPERGTRNALLESAAQALLAPLCGGSVAKAREVIDWWQRADKRWPLDDMIGWVAVRWADHKPPKEADWFDMGRPARPAIHETDIGRDLLALPFLDERTQHQLDLAAAELIRSRCHQDPDLAREVVQRARSMAAKAIQRPDWLDDLIDTVAAAQRAQ